MKESIEELKRKIKHKFCDIKWQLGMSSRYYKDLEESLGKQNFRDELGEANTEKYEKAKFHLNGAYSNTRDLCNFLEDLENEFDAMKEEISEAQSGKVKCAELKGVKENIMRLAKCVGILGIMVGDAIAQIPDRTEKVLFKILNPGAQIPERKGACYDLFVPTDVTIQAGQTVRIPLGFACKLPKGWHALINMRSSTWKKWGICLTNQTGIIDNAYCGNTDEWILSVYRPHSFEESIKIPAGTRIAQFRIEQDCPTLQFECVDKLPDESRNGFGSTGN